MKQHRDFVTYVRNGVALNALVAFSRQIAAVEHLTVVYLDPASASAMPTGEQMRNGIKIQSDVPPLAEGAVNGWKEVEADRIEGSPREVVEFAAEQRARIIYEKDQQIAQLTKDLEAAIAATQQAPGDPAAANQAHSPTEPATPTSSDPGGTGGVVVMDAGDLGKA